MNAHISDLVPTWFSAALDAVSARVGESELLGLVRRIAESLEVLTGRRRRTAAELRIALGPDAVISLAQAAYRLPVAHAEAEKWLRAKGLVAEMGTTEVVVWGRVLNALKPPPPVEPKPTKPRDKPRRSRVVPTPRPNRAKGRG